MLVEKGGGHQRHRRVINDPEFRHETKRNQRQEHDDVEPLREPQTSGDSQFDDQRAQPFPAIEIYVLRRVNQIEARDPADYSGSQHQGRPIEPAGLCDPGAGGRDREGEAEEKVGRARESLRQRVEENNNQGDRARGNRSGG